MNNDIQKNTNPNDKKPLIQTKILLAATALMLSSQVSIAEMSSMEPGMDMGDGMEEGGHGGMEMHCGAQPEPLLTVADVNADGIVTGKDIGLISSHIAKGTYYSLFDRDADGVLTKNDKKLAIADLKKTSTAFDQELAQAFVRFKHLQTVDNYQKATDLGYTPIPVPLKGHGVHWLSADGMASMFGFKSPDFQAPEGLNISTDQKRVHGMFWGAPGIPVFDNGATDYPNGESWKDGRVIAFSNHPPSFTSADHENWHKHGGLCMTATMQYDELGNGELVGRADQYLTYNECQAMPSDMKNPDGSNMWANFYMVHFWMFDLNPNGLFAGTHPCVEPDGADDDTINGDREVPHFFKMGH